MKFVTIVLIACLLASSCNAQLLRYRRKETPKFRKLGKKAKKAELTKMAETSIKGGGTIKFYEGPDGSIVAKGTVKAKGDASDESKVLEKALKQKEPSPTDLWKALTDKKVPQELKDAANRRLEAKKKKKEAEPDDSHTKEEEQNRDEDAPNLPNLGCGTFWDVMWCNRVPKNHCWCQRTGNAVSTVTTDCIQTTVLPYRGTIFHSLWWNPGRGFVRLAGSIVNPGSYNFWFAWLTGGGQVSYSARVTSAVGDGYHRSLMWGS